MFHFPTTRQARVFTLGEAHRGTRELWFVFHGYGQLAEYFIKHFEPLAQEDRWIIAPEALSRFYLKLGGGRVGASWMTKEDRLIEIEDQVTYLNSLLAHVMGQIPHQNYKVHVLGFSQGVATAYRWLMHTEQQVSSFTAWAGKMPEEYPQIGVERFAEMKLNMAIGSQDQFISLPKAQAEIEKIKHYFPHIQSFFFEGKHEMHPPTLLEIASVLRE